MTSMLPPDTPDLIFATFHASATRCFT